MCVCVYVCVCVRERERGSESERVKDIERTTESFEILKMKSDFNFEENIFRVL